MVLFGQKWLHSGKVVVIARKWLLSGKVFLFGQKLLSSGNRAYIRANAVVFVQGGCIWAKWLCSCRVVLFGQGGCSRAKVVVLGQKWFFFFAKYLYSGKVGIFG